MSSNISDNDNEDKPPTVEVIEDKPQEIPIDIVS